MSRQSAPQNVAPPHPQPHRNRVLAAGALVWRQRSAGPATPDGSSGQNGSAATDSSAGQYSSADFGGLELLLVRSARWGDWSWPKGKLDDGETLPECAVREVAEETGVQVELGVPLPATSYLLPDGQPKTVSYWAGRVRDTGVPTALAAEIAEIAWLPVEEVLARLTRSGDRAPLDALLALHRDGVLATRPLLVVRHAKARSRAHWGGGEADRPLTRSGRRQAAGLAGLLACWEPERVLCSPWARCMQTLRPYLDRLDAAVASPTPDSSPTPNHAPAASRSQRPNRSPAPGGASHPDRSEPEVLPLLSEQGLRDDPARVGALITDLLAAGHGVLVCTHRPVLEAVLAALAPAGTTVARAQLPVEDPWLTPAEVLIAHVSDNPRLDPAERIRVIERHHGTAPRHGRH